MRLKWLKIAHYTDPGWLISESLDSSSTNRNINNDLMFFVILYSIFIFSLFSSFVIVIYRMITGVYCRSNNEANANEWNSFSDRDRLFLDLVDF